MTGKTASPGPARALPDAHELFAVSQLGPHEGIEDAVARIEVLLGTQPLATALPADMLTGLRRMRKDTNMGAELFRVGYNACLDAVLKELARAFPATGTGEPVEPDKAALFEEGETR